MIISQYKDSLTRILNNITSDGRAFIVSLSPEQLSAVGKNVSINPDKSLILDHSKFVEQTLASTSTLSYLIESEDDTTLRLTTNSQNLKGTKAGKATHIIYGVKFPMLFEIGTDVQMDVNIAVGQDIVLPSVVVRIPNLL